MPLGIDLEGRGEVTVLRLAGDLDVYTVRDLRAKAEEIDPGGRQVVLDMTGIRFLDSAGVTAIVSLLNQARAGGRSLGMVCPADHEVTRILAVAGLQAELVIQGDLAGCCAALGVGAD